MTKLIHEYAIEPGCLGGWETARYILENLGISEGRIVSELPDDWLQRINECTADIAPEKRKSILELVNKKRSAIWRFQRTYDQASPWVQNVIRENIRRPFSGIITQTPTITLKHASHIDALDRSVSWWNVSRSKKIRRTVESLSDASAELLMMSKQVVFVDPYFSEMKPRFFGPLMAWLNLAMQGRLPSRMEYHTTLHEGKTPEGFANELRRYLCPRLPEMPEGSSFAVIVWNKRPSRNSDKKAEESLHGRYILTEIGGIQFDHGLDEGRHPGDFTDVHLMDQELHQTRWLDFQADSKAFTFQCGWFVDRDDLYPITPRNGCFIPAEDGAHGQY